MGATRNTGYLENLIAYDASNNVAIATTAIDNAFKITMGGSVKMTGALSGTSATFSGTVGIGTATSPAAELQVGKASDVTIALSNSSSVTSGNRGTIAFYNSAVSTVANIRAAAVTDNVGTELQFFTRPAAGSLTQVFTLASTGAATFSTSSSNCSIAINNTSNTPYIRFDESGSAKFFIGQRNVVSGDGGTGYDIYTVAGNDLRFFSGGVKSLTLATTGAATFSSSVTAGGTVQITGAGSPTTGAGLEMGYGNFTAGRTTISSYNRTGAAYIGADYNALDYIWYTSGSQKMTLTNGGNVGIGTTSPAKVLDVYSSGTTNTAQIVVSDAGSTNRLYLGTFSNNSYISCGGTYQSGWSANGSNAIANIGMFAGSGASTIQFETSTTNGAGPTERMRITSGGNVLIGKTTNAGGRLQVSNGTNTFNVDHNADGPYLTGATDNNVNYRRLSYDATEHVFLTSATERMRITSGGNVGIGTTSPSNKLEVVISSGPYNTLFHNSSTSTSDYNAIRITQGASGSATGYFGTGGSAAGNTSFQNTFVIGTQTNHAFVLNTNDTERMRITSGGKVGINWDSPASQLSVRWDRSTAFSGIGVYDSQAYNASNHGGTITFGGTYTSGGSYTEWAAVGGIKENTNDSDYAGALAFYTRPNGGGMSERMRITSGGNVCINTNSEAGGNARLSIVNNASQVGLAIKLGASNAFSPISVFNTTGGGIFDVTEFGTFRLFNALTVPSSNITNGGTLYVEGGALKFRGSSGTITTIANA